MSTKPFIAKKIKIGFQERTDCFTGKLAYVICYDLKGKLRKESSWNSWRDKKIPDLEFDNVPMDGFTLNKDIKRYHGGWFSSHRTMIRVHDPRGFEFEVTTENLIGILMHTDCLKRGLIGQFVYAWIGAELVLLPTNSEEYREATAYTENLSKSVKSKELVVGASYKDKKLNDVIYMGKPSWYRYSEKYYRTEGLRNEYREHVFYDDSRKEFFHKKGLSFLSYANTNAPVSNYAELMDAYNKKVLANKIVKYELVKVPFDNTTNGHDHYGTQLKRKHYYTGFRGNGSSEMCRKICIELQKRWDDRTKQYVELGYSISNYGDEYLILETGEIKREEYNRINNYSYRGSYATPNYNTLEDIQKRDLYNLVVTFENNKTMVIDDFYKLQSGKEI